MRRRLIIGLALVLLVLVPVVAVGFWMWYHGGLTRAGLTEMRVVRKAASPGLLATLRFVGKIPAHVASPRTVRWGHPLLYGFGWLRLLVRVVLLVVIVGLIALGLYYLLSGRHVGKPTGDRSIEILRERFARGEISEEQFRKMKDALRS